MISFNHAFFDRFCRNFSLQFIIIISNVVFRDYILQSVFALDTIKEVPVHEGYRVKYSFKDRHYLDLEILPNPSVNNWMAITLKQGVNGSNILSLQTYNGNDLEEVRTPESYHHIGNCRQIRTFLHNNSIFLIASKCDKTVNNIDIVIVDPVTKSLTVIQTMSHSFVEDAQFWCSINKNELNLILISRVTPQSKSPSTIFHYVFNENLFKFVKLDKLKVSDGRSATVFEVENKTYVAISNYRDMTGKFVNSIIYVQNMGSGSKLNKHQEIKSKGSISLTYFCWETMTKTEHFLLASNNKMLKDHPKIKKTTKDYYVEESMLFKWDDGYFQPFQTLLVKLPSPWIMVPGTNNVLILLTWSFSEGIISYQYDGWRFRRTAVHQKDILNEDKPTFALLKPASIAGEVVFTIFTNRAGAKRKHFFIPVFNDHSRTRSIYVKNIDWCNRTNLELRYAWSKFSSHSQYLSEISDKMNTTPEDKIMAQFNLIFGYNSQKLYHPALEIMSQLGEQSHEIVRSANMGLGQCKITDVKEIVFPGISQIIPFGDKIIALKEPNTMIFYNFVQGHSLVNPFNETKQYHLRNVEKITRFQLVKLCNHHGIYIEGMKDSRKFGNVYKIINDDRIINYPAFNVHEESNVKGFCSQKNGDCFIINSKPEKGICTIYCGKINKNFYCAENVKDETILWKKNNTIIGVNANNIIYKSTLKYDNKYKVENLKILNKTSKVLMGTSDKNLYISIIDPGEIQICKFSENEMDYKIACNKTAIQTRNFTNIKIGSVHNKISLFAEINKSIYINMLSINHEMIIDLTSHKFDKGFEPFTMKSSNFISLSTETKTTIIEFTICKPKLNNVKLSL